MTGWSQEERVSHFIFSFPPQPPLSLFLKGHSLTGDLSAGVWSVRCGSGMHEIIISAGERDARDSDGISPPQSVNLFLVQWGGGKKRQIVVS